MLMTIKICMQVKIGSQSYRGNEIRFFTWIFVPALHELKSEFGSIGHVAILITPKASRNHSHDQKVMALEKNQALLGALARCILHGL